MESKKNGATTFLAAIVNLVVHLLLINYIGLYAATLSTLISYTVLFVVRYVDIRKIIKLTFDKKTKYTFLIIIYFFISSYFNKMYIQILNLILSFGVFFIVNKIYAKAILDKIVYKIKIKS